MTRDADVFAGGIYQRDARGRMTPVGDVSADLVDVWICRRVADFPTGPPAGAALAACSRCAAAIAYNPARSLPAPKICMQCAGIEPLPLEG